MSELLKLKEVASSLSILYVEDNEELSKNFEIYLLKIFSDVTTAKNGMEAFCLYKEKKFDIIITDINMPEMNGWEFLDAYIQLDPNITNRIKLYMLSSSQSEDDVKKAGRCPVIKKFVNKPLKKDELVEILQAS